jgi:hypothetical protein
MTDTGRRAGAGAPRRNQIKQGGGIGVGRLNMIDWPSQSQVKEQGREGGQREAPRRDSVEVVTDRSE